MRALRSAQLWLAGVLALGGCATQRPASPEAPLEVEAPSVAPPPRVDAPAATAKADAAKPGARDRDPEVERRKMAASRQQSAAAEAALRAGDLDQALKIAREALMTHEQNAAAMLVLAEVFYKQGKQELVLAVAGSVLAIDPKVLRPEDASRAHNLKGFAYVATGKQEAAFQAFRKAAESDDRSASAWNNLGVQYLRIGDLKTAADCFEYATQLDPKFFRAHLNLGSARRAARDWQGAERAYLAALGLRADYPEAYFNLGVLYLDADPFPGLDVTARLTKAIESFGRYRERAIAAGATVGERPGDDIARAGRKPQKGAKGDKRSVTAPQELVSVAQADLYVELAKKGIEREKKRQERDQQRRQRDAAAPAEPAKPAAAEGSSSAQPPAAAPVEPKPASPPPDAAPPPPAPPPVQTVKPGVQRPGGGGGP